MHEQEERERDLQRREEARRPATPGRDSVSRIVSTSPPTAIAYSHDWIAANVVTHEIRRNLITCSYVNGTYAIRQ